MIVLYSRLISKIPIKRSIIDLDQKAFVPKEQNEKNVAIDSFFWQNEKEYLANNSTSQGNSKALHLPPEAEFMNVQFRWGFWA